MPFTPTDIASLWAWLSADTGVTAVGSDVSAIADQSGNGNDFSLSNPSNPAQLISTAVNGKPAIADSSTASALVTAADLEAIDEITIYIVGKQINGDPGTSKFLSSAAGFAIGQNDFLDEDIIGGEVGNGTPMLYAYKSATPNTWYTMRLRCDATNYYFTLNNGAEESAARGSNYTDDIVVLFGDNSNKQVAEVLIFEESLTGNDSDLVEYYLQQKYNHFTWTGPIPTTDEQAVITFPDLPVKFLGAADFDPGATSNSPAPITYSSDNPDVATIVDGKIHIVGVGTANITASQGATAGYTAADDVTKLLTVLSPNNNSNMANVDNSLQGNGFELWLREAGTSDPWKLLICYLDIPFQLTNDSTTKDSSCGRHIGVKDAVANISGNAVCNIDPASNEASYRQLTEWQLGKTTLEWKYQNAAAVINGQSINAGDVVYFEGTGMITETTLSPDADSADAVEFAFTLTTSTVTNVQPS